MVEPRSSWPFLLFYGILIVSSFSKLPFIIFIFTYMCKNKTALCFCGNILKTHMPSAVLKQNLFGLKY